MSSEYTNAVDPHIRLAELMNRELGTSIGSRQLRRFIGEYWDRISWFAHSIHNEIEREKGKPTRTPEQALDALSAIVEAAVSGTIVPREEMRAIIKSAKSNGDWK